jgi:hypothetical protein
MWRGCPTPPQKAGRLRQTGDPQHTHQLYLEVHTMNGTGIRLRLAVAEPSSNTWTDCRLCGRTTTNPAYCSACAGLTAGQAMTLTVLPALLAIAACFARHLHTLEVA